VPRSKNAWRYISTPPIRLYGVVLRKKKHSDNFTDGIADWIVSNVPSFYALGVKSA
jgi:hypothetical protein